MQQKTQTQEPGSGEAQQRVNALFVDHMRGIHERTDRLFAGLMLFQWGAAIAAALCLSPRTWSGPASQVHLHVWAALFLGGAITLYPVFLAWRQPGATLTRHVIAASQLLMSALLIHLMGGRIETHFHVFGSLAFLAFYRDWRVLMTATLVTALDHVGRGFFFPQSVYGIQTVQPWLWLEHAGWVVFEDVFLIISCQWGVREAYGLCERDTKLAIHNSELEAKVALRTASLSEANARLEAIATTDPLTGLPNHRALVDLINKEIERVDRYGRSCALLFLDLDHFKALNDGRGHVAGDAALSELGSVAKGCLRGMDTLGRWGGEEFVVLLPETDAEAALEMAERLRAAVAAHSFLPGGGLYLTCSMGVAAYPAHASDRSALVEAADRAMYAAKKLGRNQVRSVADPIVKTLEAGKDDSREEVALQGTVEALAVLVEARDAFTGEHTKVVEEFAKKIAGEMGLEASEVRLIGMVGKLHDIGKVAIPDTILQKPGALSEEEWALMHKHPLIGSDVVSRVPTLRMTAPGIRGHHERWDGTGYPDGLAGEKIPLAARIVSVADCFSAMTTDRPYRAARSQAGALEELRRAAGTHFDPTVVNAMERLFTHKTEELRRAA